MSRLAQFFRLFRDIDLKIAELALALVIAAISWGVFTRHVTATPAAWTNEVATLAFGWVIFPGAAVGFRRGIHIFIDILVERLPIGLRRAADILSLVLVAGFCAVLTWLSLDFALRGWGNLTPVLGVPVSLSYAAAILGFGLIAVHACVLLARSLRAPVSS